MIASDQWINLPVGMNLCDHVGVSFVPLPVADMLSAWLQLIDGNVNLTD